METLDKTAILWALCDAGSSCFEQVLPEFSPDARSFATIRG
ncbi:hypothetical protein [Thiomonas bhubaneswarensis]|nr:hypothetical protein [Thiomonas bhubaneswarensis]